MTGRTGMFGAVLLIAWAGACDDSGSKPGTGGGQGGGGGTSNTTAASPAKTAAMQWARAVASGDLEAAKAVFAGDAAQMKGVESYVAIGASETKLMAALKEKFGGEHKGGMLQDLPNTIEGAEERIEGDTATLTHDRLNEPLTVKKQPDGSWKVSDEGLASGTMIFDTNTKSNLEAEADVRAGKFKTAEEAWQQAASAAAARFGAPGASPPPGGGGGASAPGGGGFHGGGRPGGKGAAPKAPK